MRCASNFLSSRLLTATTARKSADPLSPRASNGCFRRSGEVRGLAAEFRSVFREQPFKAPRAKGEGGSISGNARASKPRRAHAQIFFLIPRALMNQVD